MKDEILSAMQQMLAEMKSELKAELKAEFRVELKNGLDELKKDIQQLRDELMEQVRQIETNLLTSFNGYSKGLSHRMHQLEGSDVTVNGRLEALEERILNLETRRH